MKKMLIKRHCDLCENQILSLKKGGYLSVNKYKANIVLKYIWLSPSD